MVGLCVDRKKIIRFVIEVAWTYFLYSLSVWLFDSINVSLLYIVIVIFRLVWLTGEQFLFYHQFYDKYLYKCSILLINQ